MCKYKLTEKTLTWDRKVFHRIEALKDFGDVKKGDLGGWIENVSNLSQDGDCWVYGNAIVCDNAWVRGDVVVRGNAEIYGDAIIEKMGDYIVFQNWWSSGRFFTYTKSNKMWKVGCFYGTSEELIKKAYADSEENGKMYEEYVNFVNRLIK